MARGNPPPVPRLFLDSGVLLEGLLSPWSASRAVLVLSRRRVFKIILAEICSLLTTNTRHFTKQVAVRTQLKIVTPQEFMQNVGILR